MQARRKESAKATFKRLYAAAQEECKDLQYTGTPNVWDILVFAWDNANDTFKHNDRHPQYWVVALGSIQCSAESYCMFDEVQAWCKAHGYIL